MPPRASLSPHDPAPALPRAPSPSSGITQFLSKPSRWFSRSASASKAAAASTEPRSSTSSTRKHKISRPTDPRPILDGYAGAGSRSVLDLRGALPPSVPSSPTAPSLGDLRSMSRKAWSKSADDLRQTPSSSTSLNATFHDKVQQYRARSGSSASTARPTTGQSQASSNGRHPFPTIQTSNLASASPVPVPASPGSTPSPLPTLSITAEESPNSTVHARSYSFTPKLPSKLASQRFMPPSPKRKGSAASERELDAHSGQDRQPPSPGLAPSRSAFPFSLSAKSTASDAGSHTLGHASHATSPLANANSLLAPPPAIIEPHHHHHRKEEQDENDDESSSGRHKDSKKRASQILYYSGFINRLADSSSSNHHHHHHANLSSAKSWKPFKMELKGSKLYFYKPPHDRAAAVKELFPTELVPASGEPDEHEESGGGEGDSSILASVSEENPARRGAADGRKKRAFWGRRTHPELVRGLEGVEKGSFEALVHEAVFATTFDVVSIDIQEADEEEENEPEDPQDQRHRLTRNQAWRDFASSVVLCLPTLVGPTRFESEFLRCCSYLVSGAADDSSKADAQTHVTWLAMEYLRYHGSPVDPEAWEEWKGETLPGVSLSLNVLEGGWEMGIPSSASMQALYVPTPMMGPGSPRFGGPGGMFSPRPEDGARLVSLVQALDGMKSQVPAVGNGSGGGAAGTTTTTTARIPWSALEKEGLSRDVLLASDPRVAAQSLTLYHRTVLEYAPDNVTASSVLPAQESGEGRLVESEFDAQNLRPLFGTDEQPHWLTKLVLLQVLGSDTSTGQVTASASASSAMAISPIAPPGSPLAFISQGRKSEERSPHARPHAHSRSDVITAWIRIGELCRLAGDECSWRAILSALCSRPVARLDKVWKRVDPQGLALLEGWVHPAEGEGETVQVGEPRSTPWGGDVRIKLKEELDRARVEASTPAAASAEDVFKMEAMDRARVFFEKFRTSFLLCPRKTFVVDGELDQDVKRMVGFWRAMASEGGGVGGFAAKLQRVEQFMSLSLAAEPKRKGLFEPYYWAPKPPSSSGQAPGQSLLPLLFPEPLPSLHLLDRTQLVVRGRVDSDASDVFNIRASPDHQRSGSHPQQQQPQQPQRNRDHLSQQGTVIPVYNGELLLVVQKVAESTPSSRPTSYATSRPSSSIDDASIVPDKTISRSPSIRVKPSSSQSLERKTSVAKRSSLPSLSHRPNFVITEPSTNPPLRVVVRAGTLPVLVKILVQGLTGVSVSVADDNGEMSLREGISRELVLDRGEFARVWWNVFRSFITPLAFFEALRKIYITSQPPSSSPSVGDYLHVANQRGQVLGTIQEWLATGGGAQDVLDDAQLYSTIRAFLDSTMDHAVFESAHFADPMVHQAWDGLRRVRRVLETFFVSQTMRPRSARMSLGQHMRVGVRSRAQQGQQQQASQGSREREPPDVDRADPEEFVDNLDGMAAAAFSNITEEDLHILVDLLEVQTADKTGWFSHKEVATLEDVVEIQSMYTHLQEVEPSPLVPELGHESLYRLLPTSVRGYIRAYTVLRRWLISKLIAPRLGVRGRQTRMEFLLQVVEVARLRIMERVDPGQLAVQPCVRSFVEAVVSSALVSIESRIHQRAWQCVAANRGVLHDSLNSLLSRPQSERTPNGHELTIDLGWLIERMLEVIVAPDVVDSTVSEGQTLVNFDKRRQLCNLVSQSQSSSLAQRCGQLDETNRRGFERLSLVEKEVSHIQIDIRATKDEATREALHASAAVSHSAKKVGKPFHRIVGYQMEKNRRDKNLRARLQKEKLYEQARCEKREDVFNKALRSMKPLPAIQKQHRNKKSMSAFLNFMRPLSSAFGTDAFQSPGLKRTASELDFRTTGKPAQVLSLMDAHVAQFVNNERSYTFKLDTEDGGHYILQAMSKREFGKWLETISRVAKSATKRRLTYLGNSPKPVLSDHLHVEPVSASRDPTAVFGVELELLLQREAGGVVPPGAVPRVVDQCLFEVESRGLSEVGIYRIAGAATEINSLKDAFNRGDSPIRPETDIHAVCDLVKSWFRVLPEPVFPPSSYYEIMQKMQLESLEDRLAAIRAIVQKLPQANFNLLRRVSEHLDKVTDFEEQNQMTAEALAIVFSPNLLRAPQNDFVMILANMGHTHKLVKALITHYHVIFDAEAEAHSEDEYDAPILEEDEEEEEEEVGDEIRARPSDDEDNTTHHDS